VSNEIYIRDVSFTLPNATGNFTITDTSGGQVSGLTPKAAMIVLSGATALDTLTAHARVSIGFTDGTNTRAVASFAEDNAASGVADTGRRFGNSRILNITGTASEALGVGATFTSFAANAITINVDTASTLMGFVRFFYGANLSANVTSFVGNATVNLTATTTAPGFTPDLVFAVCPRTAADFGADAGAATGIISIGAAARLPSITQACLVNVAEDVAVGVTSVGSKPHDNRILAFLTSVGGVITETATLELTSFDANGFTVTTRDGSVALTGMYLSLSLNGEKCHAGCPVLLSSTAGIKSYTTPGFQPRAVAIFGQKAPTVNTGSTVFGAFSIGGATMVTPDVTAGWNDNDNVGTSQAECVVSASKMLDMPAGAASRWWTAALTRMTASGFDYEVMAADTVDLPTVVVAIGEQPPSPGWIDARSGHRWRRCLARR
jgi:hypothetical protein